VETQLSGHVLAQLGEGEARALAAIHTVLAPDPEALLAEGGDHRAHGHRLVLKLATDFVAEDVNPDAGVQSLLPEIGIGEVPDEVYLLGGQAHVNTVDDLAPRDVLGHALIGALLGLGLLGFLGLDLEPGALGQSTFGGGVASHAVAVDAVLDVALGAINATILVEDCRNLQVRALGMAAIHVLEFLGLFGGQALFGLLDSLGKLLSGDLRILGSIIEVLDGGFVIEGVMRGQVGVHADPLSVHALAIVAGGAVGVDAEHVDATIALKLEELIGLAVELGGVNLAVADRANCFLNGGHHCGISFSNCLSNSGLSSPI